MTTTARIQMRRDTAAAWTSANPTLSAGEPGYETDTGKFKVGDGATAWVSLGYFIRDLRRSVDLYIPVGDETTAITTGTAKATFRMPFAMALTSVRGSLSTAQATGTVFTVDVNEAGTSVLSTKLTIDNTEKTSTTAAVAPVISDAALADDAEITVDVDQIGDSTAKGLKVWLIGSKA